MLKYLTFKRINIKLIFNLLQYSYALRKSRKATHVTLIRVNLISILGNRPLLNQLLYNVLFYNTLKHLLLIIC